MRANVNDDDAAAFHTETRLHSGPKLERFRVVDLRRFTESPAGWLLWIAGKPTASQRRRRH